MKQCGHCRRTLPLAEFSADKHREDGRRRSCRDCNRRWSLAYYHRASMRQRRDWELRKTYGLTHEEYDQILLAQNGACGICCRVMAETLHVDHDHETGQVRGLLCRRCNQAIARLGDSVGGLERALAYLRTPAGVSL